MGLAPVRRLGEWLFVGNHSTGFLFPVAEERAPMATMLVSIWLYIWDKECNLLVFVRENLRV
jgi:hypothetical protein